MSNTSSAALERFRNLVGVKFQLYNSLFTSLPFHRIEKTGILLSLFLSVCEEGFKKKLSPKQIIEDFFNKHTSSLKEEDKLDLLFRFVQYAERQVVLFDALEDAAFREVNDMNGVGTLKHLESEVVQEKLQGKLAEKLKDFNVLLVLTAHPTQFYPGPVLGIINDLSKALAENNASQVNVLLQQLGKTPFFKHQKPTPYDEAVSLIWYLENVFYAAAGRIASYFKNHFADSLSNDHSVIRMGFWPGGDRDGNPFVKSETTLQVAEALRGGIIKCYYLEIRRLKRRLTFQGVDVLLADLERKLYNNIFVPGQKTDITQNEILRTLDEIRDILIHKHNSLFLHLVNNLKNKVQIFGLHFASLDLRQESSVHGTVIESLIGTVKELPENYASLNEDEKIKILSDLQPIDQSILTGDEMQKDTIESVQTVKQIQRFNGVQGCNRYIISHCNNVICKFQSRWLYIYS